MRTAVLGMVAISAAACSAVPASAPSASATAAAQLATSAPTAAPTPAAPFPTSTPPTPTAFQAAPVPAFSAPTPTAAPITLPPDPIGAFSGTVPTIAGCSVLPADNAWNQDVSSLPVEPNSSNYIAAIDSSRQFLHADFGSDPSYGIPYTVVPGSQPFVPITFTSYGDESDPGPYPIPANAPIEQGSDAHVLVLDSGNCHLYEMYHASPNSSGGWDADSGAIFDLHSDALRQDTWTSADAAGLPTLPGLARYDEVTAGVISHALRFTVSQTQDGFIHPATHQAGVSNVNDPPMGLRLRLKASFDLSPFHGEALVILTALKKYGMIVADNGSSWFISGATDPRWDDTDLDQLKTVPGDQFEAVQTGPILH